MLSSAAKIIGDFYGLSLGKSTTTFTIEPGSRQSFEGLVTRISHQLMLSRIIQKTPSEVPFWSGETYLPLLTKFIPRMFWPEKPLEDFGNQFGHRYGFLLNSNTQMSINIPWLPELFANFGWYGLIIGMPFFGFLIAVLEHFFSSSRLGELESVIGITIISPVFFQDSNFSNMMGNIPLLVLTLWIYFRFGHWVISWARRTLHH